MTYATLSRGEVTYELINQGLMEQISQSCLASTNDLVALFAIISLVTYTIRTDTFIPLLEERDVVSPVQQGRENPSYFPVPCHFLRIRRDTGAPPGSRRGPHRTPSPLSRPWSEGAEGARGEGSRGGQHPALHRNAKTKISMARHRRSLAGRGGHAMR
jgi:hypothetical protein